MRQTPEEIKTEADIKVARWLVKNYEYRTAPKLLMKTSLLEQAAARKQQKTTEILKIKEIEEDIRKHKKSYLQLVMKNLDSCHSINTIFNVYKHFFMNEHFF